MKFNKYDHLDGNGIPQEEPKEVKTPAQEQVSTFKKPERRPGESEVNYIIRCAREERIAQRQGLMKVKDPAQEQVPTFKNPERQPGESEYAYIIRCAREERIAQRKAAPKTTQPSSPVSLTDRLKREIFEIEKRTDLNSEERVSRITHISCVTCAGIAVQPIPFADIFILTPIQAYMGSRIAAIRGVPVSESEAATVIKEIIGVIGMGFMAQQIAIGIWKSLIPGAGGFMTIPIVYGLTYAIMRVMDAYFQAKAANRKLSPDEIKSMWKSAKAEGENRGRSHENERNRG